MVKMLFAELPQVGLRPDQKTTIDSIEADLEKLADVTKEPRTQLAADIAEGVSAGKLNKAKTDADLKKLVQAADSTATSVQDAFGKLHKTLDAAQRKKVVELMRAKAEEHREHGMGAKGEHEMGPKGEHGMGAKGEHEMGPKGEHGMGSHMPVEKLAEQLGLSPEQRDKLKAKLEADMKADKANMKAHMATMQKRVKTVGDAFESDSFDPKKAGVAEHAGDMAKMMVAGRIRFVESVLSVLTPEQRAKFAEHVRQHAEDGDED
jgi:Spy/CpxP family protein refolding chaperone